MEEKEKPRLARLTAIITQLQSHQMVTATDLAARHKVSVRTIYRDIRTLEKSGVPIVTEEGKGYTLMDGYQLPPVLFTEAEANALITAEQLVLKNRDQSFVEQYSSAVEKIRSTLKGSQKQKAFLLKDRVLFGENKQKETSSDTLMQIQSAITDFRLLEIEYLSLPGETTRRMIEPYAFYSTQGKWLLIAWCRLRDTYRVFRLDRIQKIIVQNQTFTPHEITFEQLFERYIKNRS